MENVKLDLIPGRVMPICHASQYDVGRVIRFNLVENDVPYVLDGTETVTFDERKIDGNVVTAACTVTATKSYVDLETTEQMCACYGQNLCELKIEKGDVLIGSLNFVLDVERDPLEGGIQSESEIYNLQVQITAMANAAVAEAMSGYDIYGAYVTEQTSGVLANFTDGADNVPVKALSVEFAASQASGTPTPSSPIPITPVNAIKVTRTGKNQIAGVDNNILGLSNNVITYASGTGTIIKARLVAGQSYIISGVTKNRGIVAYFDDMPELGDTTTKYQSFGNSTYTFTADYSGFALVYIANSVLDMSAAQLEVGSTATAYEAYNGVTKTLNLGGDYYGGEVDALSGEITLTRKIVDLGNLSWSYVSQNDIFSTYVIEDLEVLPWNANLDGKFLCECGKAKAPNTAWSNLVNYEYGTLNGRIRFKDNNFTDATLFRNSVAGYKIMYPLATPIILQASNAIELNTLLGDNNIFSDAGDVDVTYRADTALYIDKRLNA